MTSGRRVALGAVLALTAASTVLLGAPAATADDAMICVGVVIDPTGSGSTRPPDQTCVTVAPGATGLDVLNARADALNRPRPRVYQGEICAIDGEPTTGCLESDGHGGSRFWSYWHQDPGTSSWSFSNFGAATYQPVNGSLEGWAFQAGGAERDRKPPPAAFAGVCPQAAVSPTPTPAPPSPVAIAPSPVVPTTSAVVRSTVPTSSGPIAHRPTRPTRVPSPSPDRSTTPLPRTSVPVSPSGSDTPSGPTPGSPSVAPTSAAVSQNDDPSTAVGSLAPSEAEQSLVVATRDAARARTSSNTPWVTVGAVVLALGLGGAATVRARRR